MRKFRVYDFLSIMLSLMLLTSCASTPKTNQSSSGNNNQDQSNSEEGSNTLSIKLNLTNPEAKKDSYMIYFVVPGQKVTVPGEATQSGKSIPFKTNPHGTLLIDFEENSYIRFLIFSGMNIAFTIGYIIMMIKDIIAIF